MNISSFSLLTGEGKLLLNVIKFSIYVDVVEDGGVVNQVLMIMRQKITLQIMGWITIVYQWEVRGTFCISVAKNDGKKKLKSDTAKIFMKHLLGN